MQIEYRRTAQGSFMLIEGSCIDVGYEEKMLKKNDIKRLLDFHTMDMNGRTDLWYEISGMRSLRDIVMTEGINHDNLYAMFSSIRDACKELSNYLIGEERLLLLPDTVFFVCKNGTCSARLCYCPALHEDMSEQLGELMRFLIENVDHTRPDITTLCYELHAITERSGFSFYDIMEKIDMVCKGDEMIPDTFMSYPVCDEHVDRLMEDAGITEPEEKHPVFDTEKKGLKEILLTKLKELLPPFLTKKERFLPKRKDFRDIEFDEITEDDGKTVLLSESSLSCRGRLIYESGGSGGEDFTITKSPFSIGSKQGGNDAVLHSDAVSRYHARITKREGGFYIEDLNSTNSTSVNGELLAYNKPKKLSRMDMISFADVVYRVV